MNDGNIISVVTAAEKAAVTTVTIRNWCKDLKIGIKVGGRWKVKLSELNKVLSGELNYVR